MCLQNAGLESHIKASISFSEGIFKENNSASRSSSRQRYCFAILIFSGKRIEKAYPSTNVTSSKPIRTRTHRIVFAASSESQRRLWLNDLNEVLGCEKENDDQLNKYPTVITTPLQGTI